MKIKIITAGTRGDVQPYVALGKGLIESGHEVTLCTEKSFEAMAVRHGVPFAEVRAEYAQLAQSEEGKEMMSNPLKVMSILKTVIYPMMTNMLNDFWKHCQDADLIVYHPKSLAATHISEKLDIPIICGMVVPMLTPTAAFANPVFPKSYGGYFNKMSYWVNRFAFMSSSKPITAWRKETLNLPKRKSDKIDYLIDGEKVPAFYAFSPSFLRKPGDWGDNIAVTGALYLDEHQTDWQPSSALADFVNSDEQTVAIAFSSMPIKQPEKFAKVLTEAILQSGKRAIIVKGWGDLPVENIDGKILVIPPTPFSWLFSKVDMVIHHGGAGTTNEVLRAGKPMLICPFGVDQYFWGNESHRVEVGHRPIPQKNLTVNNLSKAIKETIENPIYAQKAAQLGAKIRGEDGVKTAIAFIEKHCL